MMLRKKVVPKTLISCPKKNPPESGSRQFHFYLKRESSEGVCQIRYQLWSPAVGTSEKYCQIYPHPDYENWGKTILDIGIGQLFPN